MIYCVEDDVNIRELVSYALKANNFAVKSFATARDFFITLEEEKPECILLDIMLPEEDGISILKRLRNDVSTSSIPVIMLTAKDSEYDKILGLDSGADDYITKPFSVMELISRIRAVLRRSTLGKAELLVYKGLELDSDKYKVIVDGEEIALTLKEFELLRYLMMNSGRVVTRDSLLETVWGFEFDGETRTIDVHVRTLRQKLGDYGEAIETVRGVGYRFGVE